MPQDSFGSLITATNSPDRPVSHQELNSGAGLAAVIHLFRGKPCTLIHEDGGADLAKPLCSQPSEDGDQQLIWTDNMDFITLVAACCCSCGGSSVQAFELCINVRVWPGCRAGTENRGHTLYPRIFIILSGPIYFQASVQPFMQDENNSFSCFLPEHWRSSG